MFSAIRYESHVLYLLDQKKLPNKEVWIECRDFHSVVACIKNMTVRGAPAIGCSAAFALSLHARTSLQKNWEHYERFFKEACQSLKLSRPTAVNLFQAIHFMGEQTHHFSKMTSIEEISSVFELASKNYFDHDLQTSKTIGNNGAALFSPKSTFNILTHCNTGSLATAGYGTALGVIRSMHMNGLLGHVYVGETRPWLQGSRLTSYELSKDSIPHTIIVDSAGASLMKSKKIDAVILGADRIAANGDTANKIGTYALAIAAKHHGVRFYVAAPWSSIDCDIHSGDDIKIEERDQDEILQVSGIRQAPDGAVAYNPAFDVTPAALIDGVITETGVLFPKSKNFTLLKVSEKSKSEIANTRTHLSLDESRT